MPTEPGLYFARTFRFQWWNLIVNVEGTAPFLRITCAWNLVNEQITSDSDIINRIQEFGPRIETDVTPVLREDEK